jgi:glucose-6-phosphate isomerase
MNYSKWQLWQRFQKYYAEFPQIGLAVDISRMSFPDEFLAAMDAPLQKAFSAMSDLEHGALANPDEKRMVGHYWLRNPDLAPTPALRDEITQTISAVKSFAAQVHKGTIKGSDGPFQNLLLIGIGGSALGPQFVANALGHPGKDKLSAYFMDNTDPDGIDKVLSMLNGKLGRTIAVVVSKSGGTKETRNGMLEAEAKYKQAGLKFNRHAVAVTGDGSALDKTAVQQEWLARFPMWDWVGGRTSETSAVGLLPAALQGLDIDGFLEGARACDNETRKPTFKENPAAQLALMWYYAGNGKGTKNMVVLPYKDRLELFSKYLQQLLMESLGKQLDLDGKLVNQGITVLGNKGSTDQHSYIQQLRDGLNNFFVTFIEVLQDREGKSLLVEPNTTSGDYLEGFLLGTRQALYEHNRESITLSVRSVSAFSVGVLIALFERAVGLYASLINVNAYHQPGVEAGKKAAGVVIELQQKIIQFLASNRNAKLSVQEISSGIAAQDEAESVFKVCEHLSANSDRKIARSGGSGPSDAKYAAVS